MDRRQFLRALTAMPLLGSCRNAVADSIVHRAKPLASFRRGKERDDTAALLRALDAGESVHLRAGEGSGDSGEYRIGADLDRPNLTSGAVLIGDGAGRTLVKPSAGAPYIFHANSGSADPARNISGIRLSAMRLDGETDSRGFAEHSHLLHLDGVTDLTMSRMALSGFRGDAVMLGSGIVNGSERHNLRILIERCRFDGINHENRNAISVLDASGLCVRACAFERCTRPDMPGAIDLEPNQDRFAILRDILIENCSFADLGGNVGQVAIQIPPEVERLPLNIAILGNRFVGYRGTGAEIHVNVSRRPGVADPDMRLRIENNVGAGGRRAYALIAAKDVNCIGNSWSDYDGMALLGFREADSLLRGASISDHFLRCGTRDRIALALFDVADVAIDGASFIDCGDGSPAAYAIDFEAGASERVTIRNVVVRSPSGRTRYAVMTEQGHQLTPATNREEGNDFGGLPAVSITAMSGVRDAMP